MYPSPIQKHQRRQEMRRLDQRIFSLVTGDVGQSQLLDVFEEVESGKTITASLWCYQGDSRLVFGPQTVPRFPAEELERIMDDFLGGHHHYARDLSAAISQLERENIQGDNRYKEIFDHLIVEIERLKSCPEQQRKYSARHYLNFRRNFFNRDIEILPHVAEITCLPEEKVDRRLREIQKALANRQYLPHVIATFNAQEIDQQSMSQKVQVTFEYHFPNSATMARTLPPDTHYLTRQLRLGELREHRSGLVIISGRNEQFRPLDAIPDFADDIPPYLRVVEDLS